MPQTQADLKNEPRTCRKCGWEGREADFPSYLSRGKRYVRRWCATCLQRYHAEERPNRRHAAAGKLARLQRVAQQKDLPMPKVIHNRVSQDQLALKAGDLVMYENDQGEEHAHKVKYPPFRLGASSRGEGHTWVIGLQGMSGVVALCRCRRLKVHGGNSSDGQATH